jgi:proline dehydrogenase
MFRQLVLGVAHQPWLARQVQHHPAARAVARRFVAGETIEEGLETAAALNHQGFFVSLDHLGEHTTTPAEADAAAEIYRILLGQIAARDLRTNVSLKLTQFGIDLDEAACQRRLETVLDAARVTENFIRIDMEDSAYTDRTLAMFARLHERYAGHVGPVIQAYLYRSAPDVRALIRLGARVRLCKGAYAEPPNVAFQKKADVDRNFVRLMELLLLLGRYPAIATHDGQIIAHARRFAEQWGIDRNTYEFQMLYGVRRDLQRRLVQAGYNVRVYVPFGAAWYPYLTRRLAERPANLAFLVRSVASEAAQFTSR